MSKYNFETDKLGMGGQDLSALPGSALPDLAIYLQEYKVRFAAPRLSGLQLSVSS